MKKRILAMMLAVVMLIISLPVLPLSASEGLVYYDYDTDTGALVQKTLPSDTKVTKITAEVIDDDLVTGWYLLEGELTVDICWLWSLNGDIHLILADNAVLTAEAVVIGDHGLSIYTQSTGENMGRIVTTGSEYAAGIGGGCDQPCGNISIYGGIITAVGGDGGAGIGSGIAQGGDNSCGTISIYGGVINATGGVGGAGIGSGLATTGRENSCGNISIYGGRIDATGGEDSSGIGCGKDGTCSGVNAYGGYVKATSDATEDAPAIDPISNLTLSSSCTGTVVKNTQYINYLPYDEEEATCTTAGHAAYVKDYISGNYYTSFPFSEEGLIGNESAFKKWEGYIKPLGHIYECVDEEYHRCTREGCDLYEKHDDNGEYVCSLCNGELLTLAKEDMRFLLTHYLIDTSQAVKNIVSEYRQKILEATTVAEVIGLKDEAVAKINAQMKKEQEEALSLAKVNAIQELREAAGEGASDAVKAVLETAEAAVNAAKTIEKVTEEKEAGFVAIALQKVRDPAIIELSLTAGKPLSQTMSSILDAAIQAVNEADTEEKIEEAKQEGLLAILFQATKESAILELTETAGDPLSQAMSSILDAAIAAINESTTEEEVEEAKQEGLLALELQKAKESAVLELTETAGNPLSQAMSSILNTAIKAVNEATTKEEVEEIKQEALLALALQKAKETGEAQSLNEAKTTAKALLTYTAGSPRSEAMTKILEDAHASVDKATTIASVMANEQEGIFKILAQAQIEEEAKKQAELEAKIAELKDAITNELIPNAKCQDAIEILNKALEDLDGAISIENATAIYSVAEEQANGKDLEFSAKQTAYTKAFTDVLTDSASQETKDFIATVQEAFDNATTIAELDTIYNDNLAGAEFHLNKDAALAEYRELLEDENNSDAMKELLNAVIGAVEATTSKDALEKACEVGDAKINLQLAKEEIIPICEEILASEEYSDAVKAITSDFLEEINEIKDIDEFNFALREFEMRVNLQATQDVWLARLDELAPENASDAVMSIIGDAKEIISIAMDSSIFENIYDTTRLAVERQLKAEADAKTMEETLEQVKEDLKTANDTIVQLSDTIKDKDATIAEKQKELEDAIEQLNTAKTALEVATEKMTELEGIVTEQAEELKQAKENLEAANNTIAQLSDTIKDKDATIEEKQKELEEATEQLNLAKAAYEAALAKATELEGVVTEQEEALKQAAKDIEDLQAEIERLKALLEPTFLLGDVNSDSFVDMKDILMLRKVLANAEIDVDVYNPKAADVNEDAQVDMKDVLMIRKYMAGMLEKS